MNSPLTSHQYRQLAEGLLARAIEATQAQKQDLIRDALAYLTFARAQEDAQPSDIASSIEAVKPDDTQSQYRQVRQLIKQALETPTPEEFVSFFDFTTKFWRLSIWNAYMARIQRPGARVIASEYEWRMLSSVARLTIFVASLPARTGLAPRFFASRAINSPV